VKSSVFSRNADHGRYQKGANQLLQT
jgi:hypothetical protein